MIVKELFVILLSYLIYSMIDDFVFFGSLMESLKQNITLGIALLLSISLLSTMLILLFEVVYYGH